MSHQDARVLRWVAAACALLIYVLPAFLQTPLFDPDEGLHASIAQEMAERGDYVVPRLLGQPFLDKPILYFWVEALSLRSFGMSEHAVRLPGLMFGILCALTTGLLARALFDRAVALIATLIAITMFMPLIVAQAATCDVALVSWTNLVFLCLWQAERSATRGTRALLTCGAGLGMGLAILTKGLLGVALIAIGYGLYVLLSRRLSVAIVLRSFSALLLGLLVASPWYIAMEFRVPGYLNYYFVERHIHGFTSTAQFHGHAPAYYYLPYVCLGSMPWCWYVIPLLRREWTHYFEGRGSRPVLFLVVWFFSGLLFLSIANSKLFTYALPLYPAIAILASKAWTRFIAAGARQSDDRETAGQAAPGVLRDASISSDRRLFAWLFRLGILPGIAAPPATLLVVMYVFGISSGWISWCAAVLASILTLYAWWLFEHGLHARALASTALWVSLMFAAVMIGPAQGLAPRYSLRMVAEWLNQRATLPNEVVLIGNRVGSILFYLQPSARRLIRADEIRSAHVDDLPAMSTIPRDVVIVITDEQLGNARQAGIQIDAAEWVTAGGQHVFVGPGTIRENAPTYRSARSNHSVGEHM